MYVEQTMIKFLVWTGAILFLVTFAYGYLYY